MFIKRLEIYGFKSFPYKVSIPFSDGITAIVGPNGAGKSNILDAIRWVLGEQSPKKLRIKELADLIFSGNSTRKVDFAEVKLVINNEPCILEKFKELSEVVIIRRFYRSGEGEFYINQKPCRLKDIQFLFLDLGVSSQGYGIIDQSEVTKFLDLSPKDRKILIEELAGVSKIRFTEEETTKNLLKTQENLERLKDILIEVEEQYHRLKKQSEEAKLYLSLKDRLENLLLKKNLFIFYELKDKKEKFEKEAKELAEKEKELELKKEELENKEKLSVQELSLCERHILEVKENLSEVEKLLESAEKKYHELLKKESSISYRLEKEKLQEASQKEKLKSLESELKILDENEKSLLEKLEKCKLAFSRLKQEKGKILQDYENKKGELRKAEREHQNLIREVEKLKDRLQFLKKEAERKQKEFEISEQALLTLSSEKQKLEQEERIWEKLVSEKEETLFNLEKEKKKLEEEEAEVQRKFKEVEEKLYKLSVEVKSAKDRLRLVERFISSKKPRFPEVFKNFKTFGEVLPLSKEDIEILENIMPEKLSAVVIEELETLKKHLPYIKENLVFFINKKELLEKFILQKEEKLDFKKVFSGRATYFSKDRVFSSGDGFLYLLRKKKEGFFSLKKEKEELLQNLGLLEEEIKKLEEKKKPLQKKLEELKKNKEALEKQIFQIKKELKELKEKKESFGVTFAVVEERIKNAEEKRKLLHEEVKKLEREMRSFEELFEKKRKKVEESRQKFELLKKETYRIEKVLKETDSKIEVLNKEVFRLQIKKEEILKRKNTVEEEIRKIKEYLKNFSFSYGFIRQELEYVRGRIEEVQNDLKEKAKRRGMLKEELKNWEKRKRECEESWKALEEERKKLEKELFKIEKGKHNLEVRLAEVKIHMENILQKEGIKEALKSVDKEEIRKLNLKEVEREIFEVKEKLKDFTEVNLASIKEFEEIAERYNFLLRQKEDLEKSIKELRGILQELKEISRQRLFETLEKVNSKLAEVFPQVFGGGECYFKFQGEDPLTSGLELVVRIPEKNIRHLSMLSGGEKALCVIAILISFYLTKPGPFCILDEVDAPLDEKNSLRFVRLLELIKKNSQIILITHNPHIMKKADTLIGITMEEKGISKVVKLKLSEISSAIGVKKRG
jgi:chromosome segregation protein